MVKYGGTTEAVGTAETAAGLGISHLAFVSARMRYVRGENTNGDNPGLGTSHGGGTRQQWCLLTIVCFHPYIFLSQVNEEMRRLVEK